MINLLALFLSILVCLYLMNYFFREPVQSTGTEVDRVTINLCPKNDNPVMTLVGVQLQDLIIAEDSTNFVCYMQNGYASFPTSDAFIDDADLKLSVIDVTGIPSKVLSSFQDWHDKQDPLIVLVASNSLSFQDLEGHTIDLNIDI